MNIPIKHYPSAGFENFLSIKYIDIPYALVIVKKSNNSDYSLRE